MYADLATALMAEWALCRRMRVYFCHRQMLLLLDNLERLQGWLQQRRVAPVGRGRDDTQRDAGRIDRQ